MQDSDLSSPALRGCGTRKEGGIYIDLGVGGTLLVDDLLLCPAVPLNQWSIPKKGTMMFERGGVHHLVDWVGHKHYPNVADFVAEMTEYGVSRRVSRLTNFSKLTDKSMLFLAHSRAVIKNPQILIEPSFCPTHRHTPPPIYPDGKACSGYWYECVEGAQSGERLIGSTRYKANCSPRGATVDYEPGLFARIPIWNLVVVKGEGAQQSYDAAVVAKENGINVEMVDL